MRKPTDSLAALPYPTMAWTVDLGKTLANICSYLKPGGVFVFSWEHPLHSRIQLEGDACLLHKSYLEEGAYDHEKWTASAVMQQYKFGTYLNELERAGFCVENVIEDVLLPAEPESVNQNSWYTYEKAQRVPATMIIKCIKRSG